MPPGLETTRPMPVPVLATVSVNCGTRSNVAVTDLAAVSVTVHLLLDTVSQPLQLVKVDPGSTTAVSTTTAPLPKMTEQVAPQLIPPGLETTRPLPVPALLTARVTPAWGTKVANTKVVPVIVTVQGPVPAQASAPITL